MSAHTDRNGMAGAVVAAVSGRPADHGSHAPCPAVPPVSHPGLSPEARRIARNLTEIFAALPSDVRTAAERDEVVLGHMRATVDALVVLSAHPSDRARIQVAFHRWVLLTAVAWLWQREQGGEGLQSPGGWPKLDRSYFSTRAKLYPPGTFFRGEA